MPGHSLSVSTTRRSNLLVALLLAMATLCLWALINRPTEVPPWPNEVAGYAFSPFRQGQDALLNVMPSTEQIEAEIAMLDGESRALRNLSRLRTLGAET